MAGAERDEFEGFVELVYECVLVRGGGSVGINNILRKAAVGGIRRGKGGNGTRCVCVELCPSYLLQIIDVDKLD